MISDRKPKQNTVLDLLHWINDEGELRETSHGQQFADLLSLQFATKIWKRLSDKPFAQDTDENINDDGKGSSKKKCFANESS